MNKMIYAISIGLLALGSCQKGVERKEPTFARVKLNNITGSTAVMVTTDTDLPVREIGGYQTGMDIVAGKRRFAFSEAGKVLLDTILPVADFGLTEYTVFRQNTSAPLRIWNAAALGMDTITTASAGFVKMRLVNFNRSLPASVDVHLISNTWSVGDYRDIDAGTFYNVSAAYTPYQNVLLGAKPTGESIGSYTIVIKNSADKTVCATGTFDIPKGLYNKIYLNALVLYVAENGNLSVLMSK